MKVRITVVERITKEAEVDIPDNVQDFVVYCRELYNNGSLDINLEIDDFTTELINVEKIKPLN